MTTLRHRDATAPLLHRHLALQVRELPDGVVEFSASSETPVQRWGETEILRHAPESIRLDRLRSLGALLINHDANQRAGAILGAEVREARLIVRIRYGKTALGIQAKQEVEDGSLRGVSIGYLVHRWEVDEDKKTVTAVDWEPYEVTLTPIPADPTVGAGRAAIDATQWRALTRSLSNGATVKLTPRQLRDLLARFVHLADGITERAEKGDDYATIETWAKSQPEAAPTKRSTSDPVTTPAPELTERAATMERVRAIVGAAREFGLPADDYIDEQAYPTAERAINAMLKARAGNSPKPEQSSVRMQITADGLEKRQAAIVDGLASQVGAAEDKDLGMRGHSILDMVRTLASHYDPAALSLSRDHLACLASRRELNHLKLRDANQISGSFTTVLGNVAKKIVLNGYQNTRRTARQWVSVRPTNDFKTVTGATMTMGLLKEQLAKGAPFAEAALGEASYSGALGAFGRTVKFTYQDFRNDDLGEILRNLRNIGNIAAATEDREVYKLLLGAAWSGARLTTTAAFWDDTNDRVNLDQFEKAVAALASRTITIAGESTPIEPVPRFVLVPPARSRAAKVATGTDIGTAQNVNAADFDYQVISTQWLANAQLSGSNANDYYLVANNGDAMVLLVDAMNPNPIVQEADPGYSLDVAYVIAHFFRPVLANQDLMQKAQWA